MAYQKFLTLFLFCFLFSEIGVSQIDKFGFQKVLENPEHTTIPMAVPNTEQHREALKSQGIKIKYSSDEWIFFQAHPNWMMEFVRGGQIDDFYFEYAPPHLLDDSSRALHFVDAVHQGQHPLPDSYTGRNILVGIVDTGIDHDHPDFISPSGSKRLLTYWDHSIGNPTNSPSPYNYGQLWTRQDIIEGTITSNEGSPGHGSTVSGIAVGNGLANGQNKGFAPEASIVAVKTNFSLPNWTLTIADACDFIFRIADSLNMPAVVNLSLGAYLGSHDAKDPAGVYIDQLLSEKNGRIVVCAAGNSGTADKYHVHNQVSPDDTSFVWLRNNPNSNLGANTVFFDLWTDTSEAKFEYSIGANLPDGSYADRGSTIFRKPLQNMGGVLRDTLYGHSGNQLATIEIYRNIVGPNFQLQLYLSKVDSTEYLYRFSTFGQGSYDFWSGMFLNYNEIVDDIPTPEEFPPIVNYALPDSLQSIVSSWNCSEKVVSVGNVRNRLSYTNMNGDEVVGNPAIARGQINPGSSRGPTRRGVVKPDVTATGELSLAAGPLAMINNPASNNNTEIGGFHIRNGGTSMASPVVAGSAALYLEKCRNSNWEDFKESLKETAVVDDLTGNVPNFTYGFGRLNSFDLLVHTNKHPDILGNPYICQGVTTLWPSLTLTSHQWSNDATTPTITIADTGAYFVQGIDEQGCRVFSDTLLVIEGESPPKPVVTRVNNSLVTTAGPSIQWYRNDVLIPGATEQVYYPTMSGFYSVSFTGENGCSNFSNAIGFPLNTAENEANSISMFPNPVDDQLYVTTENLQLEEIAIYSAEGKLVHQNRIFSNQFVVSVRDFSPGMYYVRFKKTDGIITKYFIKQ